MAFFFGGVGGGALPAAAKCTSTRTLPNAPTLVPKFAPSWYDKWFGTTDEVHNPKFVGSGNGDWSPMLAEVGAGNGDHIWQPVITPIPWCRWLLGILILIAAIIAIIYAATLPEPAPALPPVAAADNRVAPPTFHCSLPAEGAARAAAAIVYDAWRSLDRDGAGSFPLTSLQLWKSQGLLSAKAVGLIENRSAELKVNAVTSDVFLEALGASKHSPSAQAAAAWMLADKDEDGSVKRTEMGLLQTSGTFRDAIDKDLFGKDADQDGKLSRAEFDEGLKNVAVLHKDDMDKLFEVVQHKFWSPAKRHHCCDAEQIACGELAPIETSYNCHADYANRANWIEEKIGFCCSRYRVACPEPTTAKYDCDAGYNHWEHGWSKAKKAWCCANTGRACEVSEPYDCAAGFSNWKAGWSDSKKAWCCDHKDRGCTPKFDCRAGFSNWRAGWSPAKKDWCCSNFEKGCETPSKPYDCAAGFSNWRAGWSESKKVWCCKNEQRGCQEVVVQVTSAPYDCAAGFSNWRAGWSEGKKSWCCEHEQRGCQEVVVKSVSALYDCAPSFENFHAGWTPHMKK